MPEIRVDPLSGHKTIVADERAARPGSGLEAPPADPPIDPERDPFLEGHEDRTPPELDALRPDESRARHARLDGARRPEPLPRAAARTRVAPPREARVDLFAAAPAERPPRGDRRRRRGRSARSPSWTPPSSSAR